jgi:hypothetical protein
MLSRGCNNITEYFLGDPVFCYGIIVTRRYTHFDKTYEYEACTVCKYSTLNCAILNEKNRSARLAPGWSFILRNRILC